jgi:shikimate kinase
MNKALPERIFIGGFMGAGKSTIGKALAQKLDRPFHDLDDYIEKQAGKCISLIFEEEGEQVFREKEKAALLDAIRNKNGIFALGGGTLQNQHIVDHIKVNGLLIFIDVPLDALLSRILDDKHRPLLLDKDGNIKPKSLLKNELQSLYEQRLPFYEQAEMTLDKTGNASANELAIRLVKKIKYHVALH